MKIADFFIALGFDIDQDKIDTFEESLENLTKNFKNLKRTGVIAAATYLLNRFVDAAVNAAVSVQNLTNQTGLFGQELNRWQLAGQLSDITLSAEQVGAQIANLERNIARIRLGQGDITPFQLLGIDIDNRNAFQVLDQIREAIRNVDDATAANLIEQLGLSPNFINLLRLSRQEFEKLAGSGQFLSEEQRQVVVAMGTAITKVGIDLGELRDQIVVKAAPAVIRIAELFTTVIDGVTSLIQNLPDLGISFQRAAIAVGILGAAFFPITTAIAGLLLLIEDFIVFMRGGESVIGEFVKAVQEIFKPLRDEFEYIESVIDKIKEFGGKAAEFIGIGGGDVQESTDSIIQSIFPDIKTLLERLTFGGISPSSIIEKARNVVSFSNTFHISSSESPERVGEAVTVQQQRQFNYALDDFNNAGVN